MTQAEYKAFLQTGEIPQPAKPRKQEEFDHQKTFFDWLKLHAPQHPELDEFFSVPNAAVRSKTDRNRMLATGLKAGVPDTLCLIQSACKKYSGLALEFKSANGKVSPAQLIWIARFQARGLRVEVPRSWVEAARITIEYFGLEIEV